MVMSKSLIRMERLGKGAGNLLVIISEKMESAGLETTLLLYW